jgi:hypothetical protein
MVRPLLILGAFVAAMSGVGAAQAAVRVEPVHLQGSRVLQEQTQTAVIRNYLQGWETMGAAFDQNRADLLDRDFVGTARDKMAEAIQQQTAAGIHTRYQDKSHDIQIVFYSPEGLSIQLIDNVEYVVQVLNRDKVESTQQVRARYIAVLTPTEVRWRVRVLQAQVE